MPFPIQLILRLAALATWFHHTSPRPAFKFKPQTKLRTRKFRHFRPSALVNRGYIS
jgi:hypothetical protein